MKNFEDVESYLIQMGAQFELVGESIWVVKEQGVEVVVSIAEPLIIFRAKVMEVEKIAAGRREVLFKTLLELNATDLIHCAYALEEEAVVITSALPLENLDYNELQATLDDISLAMSNHYKTLSALAA